MAATGAALSRLLAVYRFDSVFDLGTGSGVLAIGIAGLIGVVLGVLDSTLPARRSRYLPSAAALGLAFVLPASVSMMMALGAVLTWCVSCRWPSVTERFAITAAAGLIAGESITGVGASLWQMIS